MPLLILAIGSALAGLLGVPELLSHGALPNYIEAYLAPILPPHFIDSAVMMVPSGTAALVVTLLVSLLGIATAWAVHGRKPVPAPAARPAGPVRVVKATFYVDEAIEALVLRPYYGL